MPPMAKQIKKVLTIHNHTRIDKYYWLAERDNPKVIEYLEAENVYTKKMLRHTSELQQKLYQEIIDRINQDDQSAPYLDKGYYYYERFETGKEYPLHCRKRGSLDAAEEILLDVNKMAGRHKYYNVDGLNISEDSNLLAFGVDSVGRRKYTIHIKNLKTGIILEEKMPNTTGTSVWANDNRTLFYTTKDRTLRPNKIMRHVISDDPKNDAVMCHERDNTFNIYVRKSSSGKYIFAESESTISSEYQYLNADNPADNFTMIQPREKNHIYHVKHHQDYFYFLTNWQAENFRLMKTHIQNPAKQNWQEVIAHRENVLLYAIKMFKNFMVLSERENGLQQLRVIENNTAREHYISLEEPAYDVHISTKNKIYNTDILRFVYTSLTTPNSVFEYNMTSRKKFLAKRAEVLGDFDPQNYVTERLMATAKDGVKVPISLVYKKGLHKNGSNPLLLYGYGSYGHSSDAYFRASRLCLLDRGFIFAIAHIRGGQEMGRWWYDDGRMLKKKNTFTDFIACAEELIDRKYTNPEKLFAFGRSAGGLLMGAIVNMRPDLWKAIITEVPFVDVVTTMLDENIPLTTSEYKEWGNPNIKEEYEYILSYSPYDQVEAKDYPAMLISTGLHDSQVQYWEPAKWVAKLREVKTDDNALLLHTEMEAGHTGASGRFEKFKTDAMEFAFIFDLLGISK